MSEATDEIVVEDADVEEVRNLPAVRAAEAMVTRGEVTPDEVVAQRDKIKAVMEAVMTPEVHYGTIPGVNKPTLLKPGAELLAVTFRLAPHYHSERVFHDDGHLTVISKVTLTHIPSGMEIAEGEGLCTSREKKYAYRGEGRTCPECGEAGTIKRSKFADRETGEKGWYCFAKIGGCGVQFGEHDERITSQDGKPIPNPDLADTFNTVLKMANKRALVAAILNGTAASDIFTQDVEDDDRQARASARQEREPVRQEPQVPVPRSWAEVLERAKPHLEDANAPIWLAQAKEIADKLPAPTAFQRICGVIVDIDASWTGDFPPRSRQEIRDAFAKRLDGIAPEGPEWRIGPDEEDRPTRQELEENADLDETEKGEEAKGEDDLDKMWEETK